MRKILFTFLSVCRVYLGGDSGGGLGLLVLQLPSFTLNNLEQLEIF
jgi:hypothetical protein